MPLRNPDCWLMELSVEQVRRCKCPDGPSRVDISDSGWMYCVHCRENLDQTGKTNPDPLVFTTTHD